MRKTVRISMVAIVCLAGVLGWLFEAVETALADVPTKPICAAPEYHEFDFWAGDWDAFDTDNPKVPVAHVRVDRILDGCVLLEDYQGANGSHGESFSIYDAGTKSWHQSWVTNRGVLLLIQGGMRGGEMILTGSQRMADATEKHVRGTWKSVDGGVREIGVTSTDGGKSWNPWFDLMFRPAGSAGDRMASDKAEVARLDTEYQAAVRRNDADSMARFLADDFMLVTGSGKTYSKADLLEEARSGEYQYEHQEDSEQTVRVWGDTAVITAKLWAKGMKKGTAFDYEVWFSDTYARTPTGWKYVFGQSAGPSRKSAQ